MGRLRKIHGDLVYVVVTEDHLEDGSRPILEFEDTASDFHGLNVIQYQGEIIQWLQREYGDHVQVQYTLYEDYLSRKTKADKPIPNTEPVSPNYYPS